MCVYAAVKAIAQECSSLSLLYPPLPLLHHLPGSGKASQIEATLAGVIGWKEQDLLQARGSEFHSLRYMGTGQSFSASQLEYRGEAHRLGAVTCVQHRRICYDS